MPALIDVRPSMRDLGDGRGAMPPGPKFLAWHHSAVFYALADSTPSEEWAHIAMIERYHIDQAYGVFAYHGLIFPSGRAYWTGALDRIRSHIASRNHEGVGFCFAGNFATTAPTHEALSGANLLRDKFLAVYGMPSDEGGHTDFALPQHPTTCPGAPRASWIPTIRTAREEADDLFTETNRRYLENNHHRIAWLCGLLPAQTESGIEYLVRRAQRDAKTRARSVPVSNSNDATATLLRDGPK